MTYGSTRKLAIVCGVATLIPALLATTEPTSARAAEALSRPSQASTTAWSLLGIHPDAAAQSTATGRAIHVVAESHGRLLSGYGDYNSNTGPVHLRALDLATNTFSAPLSTAPSEQLAVARTVNGKVAFPWIDPDSSIGWASPTAGWTESDGTTAGSRGGFAAVHVFDVTEGAAPGELVAVGSGYVKKGPPNIGAAAWRSTDGGSTWSHELDLDYVDGGDVDIQNFERYYWVAKLGSKVYLQAKGTTSPAPVRILSDGTWSEGTKAKVCFTTDAARVITFKGRLYCASAFGSAFDGVTVDSINYPAGQRPVRWAVDGDTLYSLATTGEIYSSTDGRSWSLVAGSTPGGTHSFDVSAGKIYIGTMDSKLWVGSVS